MGKKRTAIEQDLIDAIGENAFEAIMNAPICLWFGKPPCPLCGANHGDMNASEAKDAELRMQVNRATRR